MNIDKINILIDKYLVDYVYNAARIEGINTKYLDTKLLIEDDIIPKNIDTEKVIILKNLKEAYKRLKNIDFLNEPVDIFSLRKVNSIINAGLVKEAGYIRKDPVYITNSKYIPPIPDEYDVTQNIQDILSKKDSYISRALDLYLYVMRSQPFIDGNKRTANVFCNFYLLKYQNSIISVPAKRKKTFLTKLKKFYDSNNPKEIKAFLIKNACYSL